MRKISTVLAISLAAALAGPSQAAVLTWGASLSGSQENPPNLATATGFGTVRFDNLTNVLALDLQWQGLSGSAVAAHIHCCALVPLGNAGVVLGLWSSPNPATGSYSALFDLDLVNPFTVGFTGANGGTALGAMQALIVAMDAGAGRAYFNIHTAQFPGGEIRGNLSVPEPATLSLLAGALGLLVAGRQFTRS